MTPPPRPGPMQYFQESAGVLARCPYCWAEETLPTASAALRAGVAHAGKCPGRQATA